MGLVGLFEIYMVINSSPAEKTTNENSHHLESDNGQGLGKWYMGEKVLGNNEMGKERSWPPNQ